MSINIKVINAISELRRYQWKFEPSGSNEVKCICPVHEDSNPSVSLNVETNLWKCFASQCDAKGDIIALLAYIGKCPRATVIADLSSRYPNLEDIKTVRQDRVEQFHQEIWKSGPFLQALYKRGITDDDIREMKLGFRKDLGRITIPVYDLQQRVINMRMYQPGAPGPEKMKNLRGYTTQALYMVDRIRYPSIWICGGELKAIAANRKLNKHNVGAVSVTGAEGSWHKSFTSKFKDKYVFICMDIDAGGKVAARKVAQEIYHVAKVIYIIVLPLDPIKYPKGDINDWIGSEGATEQNLLDLMKVAKKFDLPKFQEEDDDAIKPVPCKLIEAARVDKDGNLGVKFVCNAIISAKDQTYYAVPKDIGVTCTRDHASCVSCPANAKEPNEETGQVIITLKPSNVGLLNLILSAKANLEQAMLECMGVPKCKSAQVVPLTYYSVTDTRLSAPLDLESQNKENIIQPAYIVTEKFLDLNTSYEITGIAVTELKNSQIVLMIYNAEENEDNLSSFKLEEKDFDKLKIFNPEEWTGKGLTKKLNDIYEDLSSNVTRVFFRQDLHLAIDLAYHSVLYFNFDNRVQNGWVDCLIVGDSSQAKSHTVNGIRDYYRLGVRLDCKNVKITGILGGTEDMGGTKRWFITWGIIPIHDRQLVVLDELKGASVEILGKLTDMRSSGIAQITGIKRESAHARTRLIMISNPRGERSMGSYNYGIEVVKELMGTLEDTRRFDFVLVCSREEMIGKNYDDLILNREMVAPYYSSEACRTLVLWAWTRKVDQIKFAKGTRHLCLNLSNKLCEEFSESIPICDKGTMRYKLARLSVSLACRTFSTDDENRNNVLVRMCHIQYIYDYLRRTYCSPHCGYKNFSTAEAFSSKLQDPDAIRKAILETKYPRDLIEQLLYRDNIVQLDLQNWCDVSKESAGRLLSLLDRKRALYRDGWNYIKSAPFIKKLKIMLVEENLDNNVDASSEF